LLESLLSVLKGALLVDQPLLAQGGGALARQQLLSLRDLTQAHRRPLLIAAGSQLARQLVLTQALLEDSLALLLDLLICTHSTFPVRGTKILVWEERAKTVSWAAASAP
jgi:hypothetical protein